jgi:hypothetical protein
MCGAVRYEVTAEPLAFVQCYCRECQYVSGGAAANVLVVPPGSIKISRGTVKGFTSRTDKGNTVTRQFCPECGTPMFSEPSAVPVGVVKAGTLDDRSWLKPSMTLWTKSAPPWAHIDPKIPAFEKDPPG